MFTSKYNEVNHNQATLRITMKDLSQMKYLERCILESLRITPTIPLFARRLQEPLEIDNNSMIPTGTTVTIAPWIIHRLSDFYPSPEVFDPDRFLTEKVRERHPYVFLPFSHGPRNCIGWKLALMEMKVNIASIIRSFDMTTADKLSDVKFTFEITIKPERPFDIQFRKRNHVACE